MAFTYIIWGIITLTTLGLILSIGFFQKYLHYIEKNRPVSFNPQKCAYGYFAIITIIITVLWWVSLLTYQVFEVQYTIYNEINLATLSIPIVTILVYSTCMFILKMTEKKLSITFRGRQLFSFMSSMTFITALIYGFMVNNGIQLFIFIQSQT